MAIFSVRVLKSVLVRSLVNFLVRVLTRGGLSHPEKPVGGSLVQFKLTLLRSQAREVEITMGVCVCCLGGGAGLLYNFLFACLITGSGMTTRGG